GGRVDVGRNVLQQPHQLARFRRAVVDAVQHDIFGGDAPRIVGARIFPAGLQQLLEGGALVDWHENVAHLVRHRMERDGEIDAKLLDRKSTRLNSSHVKISYAVFCLKKKKNTRLKYSTLAISYA